MSKARVWYEVSCPVHGVSEAKNVQTFKRVVVACPPSAGVAKKMGCPRCKAASTTETN